MDDTTQAADRRSSTSRLSSWERWVEVAYVWLPYATLAISVVLMQAGSKTMSDRLVGVGLTLVAAAWTWLTFTRHGSPSHLSQRHLRIYFAGFLVIATLLIFREPVFLVYGITGFFHASLLRPWWIGFVGIGATGMIIHSHIVTTESTATTWAIYVGVVAIQTVAVGAGLYGGEMIAEIAEERRQTLEQLELTMDENAGLHAQLVAQAREAGVLDERQRMAREIHDTIAQGLTGVITQIEAINQSWDDEPEVRRRLDIAVDLARDSLDEARRSVQDIRPASLEESRLPDALADVAQRWSETSGVEVQVHTTGDRRRLRPEVEVTLLRAAQEGLVNIAKHATASRAGVTLAFMDDAVALDIRDDGTGFDTTRTTKRQSFGLTAMRQRVENTHGVMHVESTPGHGTAISVNIPTAIVEPSNA